MIHPKFYKYTLVTNLILCGGLFIPLVGLVDNRSYRYLPYDIFHAPAFYIKKIVDWKFQGAEELTIWNSYNHVGPLLNLLSSSCWVLVVLIVLKAFGHKQTSVSTTSSFWKTAYKLNLFIALILFVSWVPMTDFFIRGISHSFLFDLMNILFFPFAIFGIVPGIIGSLFLETGGDTRFGFSDTKMLTKIASSFGVTVLTLLIAWIRWLFVNKQKPSANKILPKAGLR